MKSCKFLLLTILFTLISTLNFAQNEDKPIEELSLTEGTIDDQFEYIIRRSNRYQEFKVVKTTWLYTLKEHTLDSLKALHSQLDETQNKVNTQQKEISDLQTNLNGTKATLDATIKEKDSMALFGYQMSKVGYNMLMWSVIAALFALLLLFIYKFRNSNAVTKGAKKALEETESEFEEHRRTALEREQKVRRQLQDELNKQKGNN